jgi:hypothetical protein
MRNKEITVLHNGKTGKWADIDRDDKIKSLLQKITWLENIVQECINMDKHHNNPRHIRVNIDLCLIKLLKDKLKLGRLITKSDMSNCNEILIYMKRKYKFNIDWRGDIVDCKKYTKLIMNQKR